MCYHVNNKVSNNTVIVATSIVILGENCHSQIDDKKQTRLMSLFNGRALIDPGASGSLATHQVGGYGSETKLPYNAVEWSTPAGNFNTNTVKTVKFRLNEFSDNKSITWDFYIVNANHNLGYDMIIGRDLLVELGIILDFKNKTIKWDNDTIAMDSSPLNLKEKSGLTLGQLIFKQELAALDSEPKSITAATNRAIKLMDVEYEAAKIPEVVAAQNHLNLVEKTKLTKLLTKYKHLFDGNLGRFNIKPVAIELKKM